MSRLINPGVGDISDRLTVLALKILFAKQSGKPTTHFETEQTALLSQIRARTLNGVWFDAVLDLGAVNAALWHAEDDLREWRDSPATKTASGAHEVMALAFRIQELNDLRAGLIEQINTDSGDDRGKEKV